eukprot:4976647-Pyramimonas_sp.AAC.1
MLPVRTNIVDAGPNVKLQMFVKPKAKDAPIHEQSSKEHKRSRASFGMRGYDASSACVCTCVCFASHVFHNLVICSLDHRSTLQSYSPYNAAQ